jgi:DNA-binding transcriptional ArsR family regulator
VIVTAEDQAAVNEVDWSALLVLLLHDAQLQIIEAMRWIDRPLSASQLVQVFDGSAAVPAFSYHLRHLRKLGVVKRSWVKPVRGTKERFYRLAMLAHRPA